MERRKRPKPTPKPDKSKTVPDRQTLRASVLLPPGLTQEQREILRAEFRTDLIATLGGQTYLEERRIDVVISDEIPQPVNLF